METLRVASLYRSPGDPEQLLRQGSSALQSRRYPGTARENPAFCRISGGESSELLPCNREPRNLALAAMTLPARHLQPQCPTRSGPLRSCRQHETILLHLGHHFGDCCRNSVGLDALGSFVLFPRHVPNAGDRAVSRPLSPRRAG